MRLLIAVLILSLAACEAKSPTTPGPIPPEPPAQSGTRLVRETVSGNINAVASPACSQTFRLSVDASYFVGGTGRCAEIARRSATAGTIVATLTWQDRRIDLDLVLNNAAGMNFRQSIAANRGGERVEFFVNGGTDYIFVAYLRGVDGQYLVNGGTYTGDATTPYTLEIERPE